MLKALLKKQFLETLSMLAGMNKKRRKRGGGTRSRSMTVMVLLLLFIFVMLAFMFWTYAAILCGPLVRMGFAWLYFSMVGVMALLMGVIGSVFTAYSSLYQAKDNDLLLSLPIPAGYILMSRVLGCLISGLFFEAMVIFPATLQYFVVAGFSLPVFLIAILNTVLVGVFAVSLACILAWVIAVIMRRLGNYKNIVIVVVSLIFFAIYYVICFRAYDYMERFIADPASLGDGIRRFIYPLVKMGEGATGNIVSFLIFAAIVLAFFAVVYVVLSRSFFKLATGPKAAAKRKAYVSEETKSHSLSGALLRREFAHLFSSATYMLNGCLGTFFAVMAGAVLLIKGGDLTGQLALIPPGFTEQLYLTLGLGAAMITATNDLAAASISIEGPYLWRLQSLPIDPWAIIKSKGMLQFLLSVIPSLILALCLCFVLKVPLLWTLWILLIQVLYGLFCAVTGMAIGLRFPKLEWTNEAQALKQSLGVFLALMVNWLIALVLALLAWVTLFILSPAVYAILCAALLLAVSLFFWFRLKNRGPAVFLEL